jgi:hypothetical protein
MRPIILDQLVSEIPQAAAKNKIQIIFPDPIIAACSPGAVTLLTSTGLHFGKNLCMNFREKAEVTRKGFPARLASSSRLLLMFRRFVGSIHRKLY